MKTLLLLIGLLTPLTFAGQTTQRNMAADLIEGQASSRNFIANSGAEKNTRGWVTYADAAGTTPVNGTGGAPTVTLTRSTSSPLAGNASFVITKDAANRQGEGASYDFTVEPADSTNAAQNLIVDLYYASGGAFTAGSSSDVRLYLYDVTNSVLLTPELTYFNGSSGRLQTTFLTSAFSSSYRLIFHVATTSAAAWTLKIDRVSVAQLTTTVAVAGASSAVVLDTGNGFGSTNTNIRRYTNATTQGNALTCADSATLGYTCTVNQDGVYAVNRLDRNTGAASNFGVTKNDDCTTGGFNSVVSANQVSYTMAASNVAVNAPNPGISLSSGDVIRACDDSGNRTNDTIGRTSRLEITKVRDAALPSSFIVATGGTITTDGNFKVHTFTTSGTFQITSGSGVVDSLVVAGGGGGGANGGGSGGGAGGLRYTSPGSTYGTGSYTVTVGAGGAVSSGAGTNPGVSGGNSVFDTITATGGGGGGRGGDAAGVNGGSGGGGYPTGGTGVAGQGNSGGVATNSNSNSDGGGGGGGAGAGGGNGSGVGGSGGAGGAGSANSITGASVTYAGGGGGANNAGSAGAGGSGGGGTGGVGVGGACVPGANGAANTGGGGGGSCSTGGGNGGSGVIIVRYQFQ